MTRTDDPARRFPSALGAPGGATTITDGDITRVHIYSVTAWFLWMLTVLTTVHQL